jgi:hypothetical protein
MFKVTYILNGQQVVSAVDPRDLQKFSEENVVILVESFK